MQAPDRVTVPTCIGCGAMSKFGTCETGCSEQKLELVRAAALDELVTLRTRAQARADAFRPIAHRIAQGDLAERNRENAYRQLQKDARTTLRRNPDTDADAIDWEQPAEQTTTWWCAECGGIDAPQPCLGICVWRPVEWADLTDYQRERDRAVAERERERRLRDVLRRISSVTPRAGQWEQNWDALQAGARRLLEDHNLPIGTPIATGTQQPDRRALPAACGPAPRWVISRSVKNA
jgi:hypothetical protein